jgi:hypothetical protein
VKVDPSVIDADMAELHALHATGLEQAWAG